MRAARATLPPGTYRIGDPCLLLDGERVGELLEAMAWKPGDQEYDPILAAACFRTGEIDCPEGGKIAVFQTAGGDGEFRDNRGNRYQVESGLIAAVPGTMCREPEPGEEGLTGAVTSRQDLECRSDEQGNLSFGSLTIATGWEPEGPHQPKGSEE